MQIRAYHSSDCQEIIRLFYDTVHHVNCRDYSPEQLDAWADGNADPVIWDRSFCLHTTLVAEQNGVIIGFADMDGNGYLDRLYVHKDHQRRGVATALCDALEGQSCSAVFQVHASITARPFFAKRGYRTVLQQQVQRNGIWLTNYLMEKQKKP